MTTFVRLAIMVVATVAVAAAGPQQQRPRSSASENMPVAVDYVPPPPTLAGLWKNVDAVARVRVLSHSEPMPEWTLPLVKRYVVVRIVLAFKGDLQETIRIKQYGGTVLRQGQEITSEYPSPLLETNQEAIVFLAHSHERNNTFDIAYGPSGLFLVSPSNNIVMVPASSRRIDVFSGRSSVAFTEFESALRALRAKR